MTPNYLRRAQRLLAASSRCSDVEIASVYLAHARLSLAAAKEELRLAALLLKEREAELIRSGSPKGQVELGGASK